MGGLVKQLDLRVYEVPIAATADAQAELELFRMVE
jgi:hypothetical protein